MPDQPTVQSIVEGVVEPSLRRTLGELGMIREVTLEGTTARIGISLPSPVWPGEPVGMAIAEPLKNLGGIEDVAVDVALMPDALIEILRRLGRIEERLEAIDEDLEQLG